jgi:ankyrin repeat protein
MSISAVRFLSAAAALLLAAPPAFAQQHSDSYEFLEAIRKEDGGKINEALNKTNGRIIDTKDRSSGETALHIVAKKGNSTYLRFLLQKKANPNIQGPDGNTPMLIAVNQDYAEGVQILIRYKANVNQGNNGGETPLIRAVQLRNAELVRMLLDAGADPDKTDRLVGLSARDYAREDKRSPAIAKMLADAPKIDRSAVSGPRL